MTAANIRLGEGTPPAPSVGEGILYFDSADQQLYAIDAAGATVGPIGVGSGVIASNAIYVQDPANGGNDGTGTRGDSTKPFATLSAAFAVAVNGDVIFVGPGSFVGPGDIAAIAPALLNVSIVGAGRELTVVSDSTGITFDLAGSKWTRFWLAHMTVRSSQFTISADGSAYAPADYLPSGSYPAAPYSSGLFVTDAMLQGAQGGGVGGTTLYNVGVGVFDRVIDRTGNTGALDVNLVGAFLARDSELRYVNVTRDYDNAKQPPAPAPGSATFRRCELTTATLKKQASFELDSCRVNTIAGDKLNVSGAGDAPAITVFRSVGTSVDLASAGAGELPDTAANILIVFGDSAFGQTEFAVAAPAVNRQSVRMLGCVFPPSGGPAALSSGDGIDTDARSSTFAGYTAADIATPGTGTVALSSFPVAAVPTALPTVIAFPFTLPSAAYVFVPSGDTLGEAPLAVTAATAANVTVTPTAALGGNIAGLVMMF